MQISARRFVRKMRGASQAHLLEATDDNFYVVKFLKNDQRRRTLVNEMIGFVILRHLEIETPEVKVIELTPEFLEASPEVFLRSQSGRISVEPGLHLASCFPGDPGVDAVYDFLPDVLLSRCVNLPDYCGAFVFDQWVSNMDSRQSIFYKPRSNNSRGRHYATQMIDNGECFGGSSWRYQDSPIQGRYFRLKVYSEVRQLDDLQPWIDRVEYFPTEPIDDVLAQIPPEWIHGDRDTLEGLLERLFTRRHRVRDLIHGARSSNLILFPNWD